METPINLTARKNAILRFIIFSAITLIFALYHLFISIAAYHTDYSAITPAEEETSIETLE